MLSSFSQTTVVTQNQVVCKLEEFFPEPLSFKPERWLRHQKEQNIISPYLALPFGHGPRACIARRLAEQNMQALILKVRNKKNRNELFTRLFLK